MANRPICSSGLSGSWHSSEVAKAEPSVFLTPYPCLDCSAGEAAFLYPPAPTPNPPCMSCIPGTYKALDGYDTCTYCPSETMSSVGARGCCPIGSALTQTGECVACSPGEFWASGICEPCAAGSYTSVSGCVHKPPLCPPSAGHWLASPVRRARANRRRVNAAA